MAAPLEDFSLTLQGGGTEITLTSETHDDSAFNTFITSAGVSGLYGTPTSKTTVTERQTGNGAHNVTDAEVLYSARTVTIPFAIVATTGGALDSMRDRFGLLAGHVDRLTVHDRGDESFLTGFLTIVWSGQKHNNFDTGTITLTCADPIRYSVAADSLTLLPTSTIGYSGGSGLGLYYGKGGIGLYYPIRYGAPDQEKPSKGGTGSTPVTPATQQNVGVLYNHGDTTSWPTITMQGQWQGARFDWSASDHTYGTLAWKGQVSSVPAIFDCKSHTVSVNGVDDSSKLTFRSFPHVPPSGSCRIVLVSGGRGAVTVSCHDTWI